MISSNWTREERKDIAFNLSKRARNMAGHALKPDDRKFVFECLEAISFLLDDRINSEFLEANRAMILKHCSNDFS